MFRSMLSLSNNALGTVYSFCRCRCFCLRDSVCRKGPERCLFSMEPCLNFILPFFIGAVDFIILKCSRKKNRWKIFATWSMVIFFLWQFKHLPRVVCCSLLSVVQVRRVVPRVNLSLCANISSWIGLRPLSDKEKKGHPLKAHVGVGV